jgi:hypothetical protein
LIRNHHIKIYHPIFTLGSLSLSLSLYLLSLLNPEMTGSIIESEKRKYSASQTVDVLDAEQIIDHKEVQAAESDDGDIIPPDGGRGWLVVLGSSVVTLKKKIFFVILNSSKLMVIYFLFLFF